MRLELFDYKLPEELIAQEPIPERDQSRLLVLHKKTGDIEHRRFVDIVDYIQPGDLMVLNDTRVTATRLHGCKALTGGAVEALLIKNLAPGRWEAMVKPGRRVPVGTRLDFGERLEAEVVERREDGGRVLQFICEKDCDALIAEVGEVPLPPYIYRRLEERERYQTVYAREGGSAAAPTAGLHFTPRIFDSLKGKGADFAHVTLHIGIATFRPVRAENILEHEMHKEFISVSPAVAEKINARKGRLITVGTTTARALESAAAEKGKAGPFCGETGIYLTPGYNFKLVDVLITNFHMPHSTLLILVSALAGRDNIIRAYKEAVREKYRFLSFGDAMLII